MGYASHTRRKIFNGNKLSRNGKVDSLIFPGMPLTPASLGEFGGIGWKRERSRSSLSFYLSHPPPNPPSTSGFAPLSEISPPTPFLQSRTLETSLHLPLGRSSRLTLIQLKTSDDRAKQRRIDHENFN